MDSVPKAPEGYVLKPGDTVIVETFLDSNFPKKQIKMAASFQAWAVDHEAYDNAMGDTVGNFPVAIVCLRSGQFRSVWIGALELP